MEDTLVPIAFFGIVPVIVWAVSNARRKAHESSAEVMKTMVNKGDSLTPELIRALGIRPRRKHSDLRTGLILIATAIATIMLGGAIPEPEAQQAFAGLAMFPLLIGIVYVALWIFIGRKSEDA